MVRILTEILKRDSWLLASLIFLLGAFRIIRTDENVFEIA
ncbi:hypothetical protein HPHPH42_1144 [Helicobacter pylori Hp H-42]|uniref:Uncharacterized protein n=1 Tax=Helicobacter pylori Hp H-42 TaxID=992047 RepID=A0AB33XGK6_HELPX|nr:hypothetical protein HPHPH42_1144 [Helicobacter pylori Hp H-42]